MREKRNLPGFLTMIMIFLVISLSVIGASALAVTGRGGRLTAKSAEYLTAYREAYNLSERRLAEVDGCIAASAYSGLFDMNFEALMEELDYIDCAFDGSGYTVSCTTPVDGRTAVYWEIYVPAVPSDRRGGYSLIARKSVDISAAEGDDDEHLNVWLG